MVGCPQIVRTQSFMKEIIVYIRASYIVFLFVNNNNNNDNNNNNNNNNNNIIIKLIIIVPSQWTLATNDLFVKTENDNFIKAIKQVLRASIAS